MRFAGRTSQSGVGYRISFSVGGGQLHHERITWHAACASQQSISRGTAQSNTVIHVNHGKWHNTGSYSATLTPGTNITGHFFILQNSGQLVNAHHARGTFRLRVVIDRAGHQIDQCNTGTIHWSATSPS